MRFSSSFSAHCGHGKIQRLGFERRGRRVTDRQGEAQRHIDNQTRGRQNAVNREIEKMARREI